MDSVLINRVLEGDKLAFKALYNQYYRNHFLTCIRYVSNREDAKDVLQEAYIQIYKSLPTYDAGKSAYKTWSTSIVINRCLMFLRKHKRGVKFENVMAMENAVSVSPQVYDTLSLEELTKVIALLPDGYRTIFNLYVIDGYTHNEIAELLKISANTSKSQLFKAKKALRQSLKANPVNSVYVS